MVSHNVSRFEPLCGTSIDKACQRLVAIANQEQNTAEMVFNGISLRAHPGSDPEAIASRYKTEMQVAHEKWMESPEGKRAARRADLAAARAQKARDEGILPFACRDQVEWDNYVQINADPYGAATVRYAARWANQMERSMSLGTRIEDCAELDSHRADQEGITGFMYGCAIQILGHCWEHGQELLAWRHRGRRK